MFKITHLHHVSIIVADTARALAFYRDTLGLTVLPERPDLGYPGAWLRIGERQIHLLEVPNPDPVAGRPQHGGRDRHIALAVDDMEDLHRLLQRNNIACSVSRSGRHALFCRDPDGNALEFVQQ